MSDEPDKNPAAPPAPQGDVYEEGGVSFIINPDGSVTFLHLPPELFDVARSLDPEAVFTCDLPEPVKKPE